MARASSVRMPKDVVGITILGKKSAAIVAGVQRRQKAVLITRRGRSAAVLEDVQQYGRRLQRLELLEAVVRGLRASQAGNLLDNKAVMRHLKEAAVG